MAGYLGLNLQLYTCQIATCVYECTCQMATSCKTVAECSLGQRGQSQIVQMGPRSEVQS